MKNYLTLLKAVEWIEDHLTEGFSLDDVARASFLSLSHLHRLFSHAFGKPLKDYIVKRRLCRAAERLVDSADSVTDIAFSMHYSNSESFSRAFKNQFRVSPTEFRKTHRFTTLHPMYVKITDKGDKTMPSASRFDLSDLTEMMLTSKGTYIMDIDIDNLKPINDDIGRGAGDIAIAEVAKRIDLSIPEGARFFRAGGDEFVVITGSREQGVAESIAKAILSYADADFEFGGTRFKVSVTIGIVRMPDDLSDAEAELTRAENAMRLAKASNRRGYVVA